MQVLRLAKLAPLLMLAFCNESSGNTAPEKKPSKAALPTASAPAELSPEAEAKDIAKNRCSMCHGPSGLGDGPTAATLNPKPRDFTSKDWQKSVADSQIRSVIVNGGAAAGKSPLMPPNPDLKDKPAAVDELVKIVRGYGK